MAYTKPDLDEVSPGRKITGIPDFPTSIYKIVDQNNVGKNVYLEEESNLDEAVILMNAKTGRLRVVAGDTPFLLCGGTFNPDPPLSKTELKRRQQQQYSGQRPGESNMEYGTRIHNVYAAKLKQEQKTMNRKFDFDSEDAKQIAVNVFKTTGGTITRLKAGKAVLTTIKSSIREIPGLPIAVLALLETPYADAVIGIILGAIVPLVTDSKIAVKASVAANLAGTVAISEKITFLEDWIEKGVAFIPAKVVELLEDDDSPEAEQPKE